ncbi:19023_t:CDS:2, partial [Gigaspora rosea]
LGTVLLFVWVLFRECGPFDVVLGVFLRYLFVDPGISSLYLSCGGFDEG